MLSPGSLFRSKLPPALVLFVLIGANGCSGPRYYPVSGKIVFDDGAPATELAGGLVSFTSQKLKASAHSEISPEATFQLTSLTKNDGAFPGDYKVTVSPFEPDSEFWNDDKHPPPKPYPLDAKYRTTQTTDLNAKVEAKSNEFTFQVKRPRTTKK